MKIVLIGFMGSGKTTIASSLATKLNLEVIDMDDLVLRKTTRKSINEIFDLEGEEKFREIESEVAKDFDQKDNVVISTGGGVIKNDSIMGSLGKNATLVYLKNSFDKIKEHIALKKIKPPLFQDEVSAKKLFELREPLYTKYADLVVLADNKYIDEIVDEIMEELNGR